MREIKAIVIHCAYTPPDMDVDAEEIRRWHVEERGWDDIGYHHVIKRDGTYEKGRPEETPGAHVYGHNQDTIGVCLAGGMDADRQNPDCNFTRQQWDKLEILVRSIRWQHGQIPVHGHREYDSSKACPTFDAHKWWHGSL